MKLHVGSFRTWQMTWGLLCLILGGYIVTTSSQIVSSIELVFLLWFVGFLGGVELLAPRVESTGRWSGIRVVLILGLIITGLIVVRRILSII